MTPNSCPQGQQFCTGRKGGRQNEKTIEPVSTSRPRNTFILSGAGALLQTHRAGVIEDGDLDRRCRVYLRSSDHAGVVRRISQSSPSISLLHWERTCLPTKPRV